MLSDPILVPMYIKKNTLHFGSEANYQNLVGSYFIKNSDYNNDGKFIYKHNVLSASYNPDEYYINNDGICGRCWIVTIVDNENNKINNFYIRNWCDIVNYYENLGYVFSMSEKIKSKL